MQYFDELWLLLLQKVDLWVLTELQCVDEAGVFDKATTIVGLNLESGRQALPLSLLFLPVAIHVSEDDAGVVPSHDLLS